MSKTVAISLLDGAQTGTDLLQILDSLVEDNQDAVAYAEPTADVIDIWSYVRGGSWQSPTHMLDFMRILIRQCFGRVVYIAARRCVYYFFGSL